MHFYNAMHTSINAAALMPSASVPTSVSSTPAADTPPAPTTPTRFDVMGDLPRSAGRSRPGLRNFCKHGRREALRRTSCKRSRPLSQEISGRKRGRADESSEATSMTAASATALAVAPTTLLENAEVQTTPSPSGKANASCLTADEASAEATHASTQEQVLLAQEAAQVSHPKASRHLEINVQLSSPALYKVC